MLSRKLCGFLAVALLSLASSLSYGAAAPPTLTFTAETVTGVGTLTPKLTWSTQPAANSCTASGATDWTGAKPAAGTATLAATTITKTFTLVCAWQDRTATLKWVAPTLNTDGSSYINPKGYVISYGTSPAALNQSVDVLSPATLTAVINGLAVGTWSFVVQAKNSADILSANSNVATKTIDSDVTDTRAVTITVAPQPKAPTNVTVE